MQKTRGVETLAEDPEFVNKNSSINKVNGDSKIGWVKPGANSQTKLAKYKNTIMPGFLAKSKSLVELSSGTGFLTLEARLTFAKLR